MTPCTRSAGATDHRDALALVTAFERLAHGGDVADAFETIVGATLGQVHQRGNQIAGDLPGIDVPPKEKRLLPSGIKS